MWGQDRLENKNQRNVLWEAVRFRALDRHQSTKPTNASWTLNGYTHPHVEVFTTRPMICIGRRPGVWHKNIGALVCRNRTTKIIDPSKMAKGRPFWGLREERRTPRATCRPLDHGSTWYFRGRLFRFDRFAWHETGWPRVHSVSRSKLYDGVS